MSNKLPLIKGSMATLTEQAREEFHTIGIHVKRTKSIRVMITQHCPVGTSFHFMTHPEKEFHVPADKVKPCFQEVSSFN